MPPQPTSFWADLKQATLPVLMQPFTVPPDMLPTMPPAAEFSPKYCVICPSLRQFSIVVVPSISPAMPPTKPLSGAVVIRQALRQFRIVELLTMPAMPPALPIAPEESLLPRRIYPVTVTFMTVAPSRWAKRPAAYSGSI